MYENNKWKYACLVLAHNCARKPLLKESERETEKKKEITAKKKTWSSEIRTVEEEKRNHRLQFHTLKGE